MTTLSSLRTLVRTQTETVAQELPDATIDWYLQQAFERTLNVENQWPFFEKTWQLTCDAGAVLIDLPGDVNTPSIASLRDVDNRFRLTMINHNEADEWFASTVIATRPTCYSVWGNQLFLWPASTSDTDRNYTLRAHRLPGDWIAAGPSAQPDCDSRLHLPMVHYAVALAYAQQEDDVLEEVYMKRWELDTAAARSAIMEPYHQRPLSMGPHIVTSIGGRPRGIPATIAVNTP